MATGTGKTFTAFQIIWRLWKSRTKKRILYLADRNILIDQTKTNDFKPFGSAMSKIVNRNADKSFEIYLSLYQAVSGTKEWKNIYKQFSPDFFDLVIVDECHRGSADEDSAWREILEYFSSATQIGMTATPKETKEVSNIHYFGEPIYTYSLKQGIDDGFLAPYKVVRIDLDKDLTGWRPEKGKLDKYGSEIEDRIYNQIDFDRTLVLEQRTQLMAKKITEYLKATDWFDKTIVFCEDIDHAERMRQALVNENGDLVSQNRKYVMRITGDNEDFNKYYFTIMDFKKATELFADPLFDGDPVAVYKPGPHDPPVPPDEPYDSVRSVKFVVSDVPVKVVAERVQYYGKDGKLITESLKDYTRNTVRKEYVSLDSFLTQWSKAEKKNLILQELEGQGLLLDKYADSGIENIETMDVLRVQPLNQFETPLEIISMFGGKEKYLAALRGLETQIYMAEA